MYSNIILVEIWPYRVKQEENTLGQKFVVDLDAWMSTAGETDTMCECQVHGYLGWSAATSTANLSAQLLPSINL